MSEGARAEELINRCVAFAKDVRSLVRALRKDVANMEDGKQLVRASGSVGANYLEAQEALSKKDFIFRAKVCRKESRESAYWLNLLETFGDDILDGERKRLRKEAVELKLIFNAIVNNSGG